MSKVQFARVRERGVEFGAVVVKDHVIENRGEADQAVAYWSRWIGVPTVLLGAQRHKWYGRRDLVNFLSGVSPSRIPWREASV